MADPALVPAAVANALGVPEAPGRPILDQVKEHLRYRELLGVIDNFEQVAEAGPVLEELLGAAPGAAGDGHLPGRAVLRGEQEYPVPALGPAEAVRLFTERAVAADPVRPD